jgi:glutamate carboxypeptidase
MDTVYPADTSFNWYREDDTYAYGPGVTDMKGGLVAGIFAIKALEFTGGLDHIPLAFLLNSDEEIGSPGSQKWIRQEASKSLFAFVLECGSENGGIVTGRKGILRLRLDLEGKAGHAAFAGIDKGSAILELSHKIIALESLNDHQRGITVNVGKVNGGIGPNTVSQHATALIDARYRTLQDLTYLEEKLSQIEKSVVTPHTKSRLLKIGGRPPMEPGPINRTLFQSVKSIARNLNFIVFEEYRKGASDANIIAQEQVPVIDGLGPIGDGDHSENERILKESLVQRTALIACALIDLWPKYSQNHQPPRPPGSKK